MIDFDKRLKELNQQPEKKLINIFIRDQQYQLETSQRTTLDQIVQRYKNNGYFQQHSKIKLYLNQKEQGCLNKTIKQILSDTRKKQINIKLHEENLKNKNSIISRSTVLENYESATNEKPLQSKSITLSELNQLIDKIQKKLPIDEKYKQFYHALSNKFKNYFSLSKIHMILDILLKSKINLRQIFSIIGRDKFLQSLTEKIKDVSFKLISIETNNQFFKEVLNKFTNNSLQKKKKKIQIETDFGADQIKIIQNIQKIIVNFQQQKIKVEEYQKQISSLMEINQQIKSQKCIKCSKSQNSIEETLNDLKQKQSSLTQMSSNILKITTNYFNKQIFYNQQQLIMDKISQHEKCSINQFESLMSIRGGDLSMEVITKLIDLIKVIDSKTKILLLVGTSTRTMVAYSKGIYQNIKYKTNSKNQLQLLSSCKLSSQICQSQAQNHGFIMQTKTQKIFLSQTNYPLIRYNNMFLYLTSCFRMLYGVQNKLQLQLRQNKRGELNDDENLLQNIFGKNVKQLDVTRLEMFKVILCDDNIQK